MPTVHKASRAFLAQVGVSHPPRTAKEIKLWLRRDPDYFSFNSRAAAGGAGNESIIGGDGGVGHAHDAEDHQLSRSDDLSGNVGAPKDISVAGDDDAQQMLPDTVGEFDVPVAEIVKKRRRNTPSHDGTTSLNEAPSEKMVLRKRAASNVPSPSGPLSTLSDKNQGLTTIRKKRKASSLDNDLISNNPKAYNDSNTHEHNKVKRLHANKGDRRNDKISKINSWFTHRRSGNWTAEIKYQGKTRHIGTFSTKSDAALANEAAIDFLTTTEEESEYNIPAEEIALNVQAAKEAAAEAVKKKHGAVGTDVILYKSKASGGGNEAGELPENKFDSCEDKSSQQSKSDKRVPAQKSHVGKGYLSQKPSGNWQALVYYHGKTRTIGTFPTQDDAALANDTAIEILTASNKEPSDISEGETDLNVKVAKEAAEEAVKKNKKAADTDVIWNNPKASGGGAEAKQLEDQISHNEVGKKRRTQKGWVRQLPSGNWEARVGYQGKARSIGTFPTQDNALLANKIAVETLTASEKESNGNISSDDINSYVKVAKDAASEAVKKKNRVMVPTVTPEPAVKKAKPFSEQKALTPPKANKKTPKKQSKFVGVYATPNGKWKIEVKYHGTTRCCMSSFGTEREAAIAKKVVDDTLQTTRHLSLPAEQMESNMQLAKEKAMEALAQRKRAGHLSYDKTNCFITINGRNEMKSALSKLAKNIMESNNTQISYSRRNEIETVANGQEGLCPDEALAELLRLECECHDGGPKLALGPLQQKKNFMQWLANRKDKWSHELDKDQRRREKDQEPSKGFSEEVKIRLSRWLSEHKSHPYPTRDEKDAMMTRLGITDLQKLNQWFYRARKRLKHDDSSNGEKAERLDENVKLSALEDRDLNSNEKKAEKPEVTRWRCDICLTAAFVSFEEALEHERVCEKRPQDNCQDDKHPSPGADTEYLPIAAAAEESLFPVPGQAFEYSAIPAGCNAAPTISTAINKVGGQEVKTVDLLYNDGYTRTEGNAKARSIGVSKKQKTENAIECMATSREASKQPSTAEKAVALSSSSSCSMELELKESADASGEAYKKSDSTKDLTLNEATGKHAEIAAVRIKPSMNTDAILSSEGSGDIDTNEYQSRIARARAAAGYIPPSTDGTDLLASPGNGIRSTPEKSYEESGADTAELSRSDVTTNQGGERLNDAVNELTNAQDEKEAMALNSSDSTIEHNDEESKDSILLEKDGRETAQSETLPQTHATVQPDIARAEHKARLPGIPLAASDEYDLQFNEGSPVEKKASGRDAYGDRVLPPSVWHANDGSVDPKDQEVQRQWRCDICLKATFACFDAAVKHERICEELQNGNQNTTTIASPEDDNVSLPIDSNRAEQSQSDVLWHCNTGVGMSEYCNKSDTHENFPVVPESIRNVKETSRSDALKGVVSNSQVAAGFQMWLVGATQQKQGFDAWVAERNKSTVRAISGKGVTVAHSYSPNLTMDRSQLTGECPGAKSSVSDTSWWYYIDRHSNIQGPFSWIQMKQWFDLGYLNRDLLISQSPGGPFKDLRTHFPDPSQAFEYSAISTPKAMNKVGGKEVKTIDLLNNDGYIRVEGNTKVVPNASKIQKTVFETLEEEKDRTNVFNERDENLNVQCSSRGWSEGDGIMSITDNAKDEVKAMTLDSTSDSTTRQKSMEPQDSRHRATTDVVAPREEAPVRVTPMMNADTKASASNETFDGAALSNINDHQARIIQARAAAGYNPPPAEDDAVVDLNDTQASVSTEISSDAGLFDTSEYQARMDQATSGYTPPPEDDDDVSVDPIALLDLELLSAEDAAMRADRPKLLPGCLQRKLYFDAWLKDRKKQWSRTHPRTASSKSDEVGTPRCNSPLLSQEEMVRLELLQYEDEISNAGRSTRSNLLLGSVQPKLAFEVWLADRKRKWKNKRVKSDLAEGAASQGQKKRKKRRQFTVAQKLEIIEELNHGVNAAVKYGLDSSQVHAWLNDKPRFLELVKEGKGHLKKIPASNHGEEAIAGARKNSSGKWQVAFDYHHKTRHIGLFVTPQQAALARETARRILIKTKKSDLSEEEIEQNLLLARKAAAQAASNVGDVAQKDEESDNDDATWDAASIEDALLQIELCRLESAGYDSPELSRGHLQQKPVFDEWLVASKRKWGELKQRKRSTENEKSSCEGQTPLEMPPSHSGSHDTNTCQQSFGPGNDVPTETMEVIEVTDMTSSDELAGKEVQTNSPCEASVQDTPSINQQQKQSMDTHSVDKGPRKKLPDPCATTELRDSAQIRHEMASTLTPGMWVTFKSDNDPDQPFWLGKTLPKREWDNQCIWLNDTGLDKDVEGAKIVVGTYAINVQWYTPKVDSATPLKYIVEGGDNARPFVQSNYNLLCTEFENDMHQVEGTRVRVPRKRTVRPNQRGDFEYSMTKLSLQTTEGDWYKRESGNVWRMDEAVRDKAMERLKHWHNVTYV